MTAGPRGTFSFSAPSPEGRRDRDDPASGARSDFEPFKTSSIFDGTAQNPERLREEPERLRALIPA